MSAEAVPINRPQRKSAPRASTASDIRRTGHGNALLFAREHGANVRYCHTLKNWLVWDGQRWKPDSNGEVVRLVKSTMVRQYENAERIEDIKHASKALEVRAFMQTLQDAQSELPIAIAVEELDRDGWLLNVANGTVDLRTGKLRPHDRNDLVTKLCPVEYKESAERPRWTQFLREVFASNLDLVPFVQRAIGYSLTADVREECLFLMYGEGRNGKGVFIKTIAL